MLNHACIPGINTTWHPFRFTPFRSFYFIFGCAGSSRCDVVAAPASEHRHLAARAPALVEHRLSCSVARGVFLDQGLNACPLHWQMDSQSLDHQRSPPLSFLQSNLPIYFPLLSQLHPNFLTLCCSFSNMSWILCQLMITTLHMCKPVNFFQLPHTMYPTSSTCIFSIITNYSQLPLFLI